MVSTQPEHLSATRQWADATWMQAAEKVARVSATIGASFPHVASEGKYDRAPAHWWTAGFWPGMLWLIYRETKDARLRGTAEVCETQLDDVIWEFDNLWHDVGFMWSLSSVACYKLTGAERSRRRALLAASVLASRFNLRGRFIRAWNGNRTGWAIIDCLMNLPLLHWASERTADPRFSFFAMEHADTVLRHFVREDGSCRHIVQFDPHNGQVVQALAGQGYSAESAWARGSAWALYGFALSYRYTREQRYLDAAKHVAEYFLAHLPPDGIPYWDFAAPVTAATPRDSSAAACAASGLLELALYCHGADQAKFHSGAVRLLRALETHCAANALNDEPLLRHAAGNVPAGENIDVSLIYGDYFYLEALAKLRGPRELFW